MMHHCFSNWEQTKHYWSQYTTSLRDATKSFKLAPIMLIKPNMSKSTEVVPPRFSYRKKTFSGADL